MQLHSLDPSELDPKTRDFYRQALTILNDAHIPFLVGGAYALERYTEILRQTKDLDLFVRPADCERALEAFAKAGYTTEHAVSFWLAKAYCGENFVDLIYNSGNGCGEVDDLWFEHATDSELLGIPVKACGPEDIIWSKAFIMSRDRYDGADIAHLLLSYSEHLDWSHLLWRFGDHWRVLLSHLILFGFIYPGERSRIPNSVIEQLTQKLQYDMNNSIADRKLCQGTLLNPTQYQIDIEHRGYKDARLQPKGGLTETDIEQWTDHLQQEKSAV